ncbi:ImmA/IrrE family metallo-endopeptidase [Ensifer sp. SL37]|uniref:ImmA/IrrE family metallo-endopeptidase n=1 Tax=Ensifer sp. SL37 TaxID=2995137 RepID=UPI002274AB08|nr:ImmA/IrrE family metallo-endopeptidase [Ensifer sp. SL37]MCY1744561.1 ImmA/IrrE family metallo-endopeptidase [Ensifer sp. SL37]
MAKDLYASKALSGGVLNGLARATRSLCDISDDHEFDIIRFLEVDLVKIIPEFHLFIEEDRNMDGSQAFVTNESTCIVVSESVYNDACSGYFYARKILAHEFGHILLHHNMNRETKHYSTGAYKKEISKAETFNSAEWQADTFAVLLVVPHSYLKSGVTGDKLQRQFKISTRQSVFVAKRINSLRLRQDTNDRGCVEFVIRNFLERFRQRTVARSEGERQLSFFA